MIKLVTRNYWWPGVTNDMKQYVEKYDQCQRIKNRVEMLVGKLRLKIELKKLWQYISVDLIMKLLISRDHNSILAVYNRFSKILHLITTTEKIMAEGLVRLFRDNV